MKPEKREEESGEGRGKSEREEEVKGKCLRNLLDGLRASVEIPSALYLRHNRSLLGRSYFTL